MIRRLVFILLLLAAPAYAADKVLYDVETVTYEIWGRDIPPYVTASISRWGGSGRIELEDAGPQPADHIRWTTEAFGDLSIGETAGECGRPPCVYAYTNEQTTGGYWTVVFMWLGGAKDPFASFYLAVITTDPHLSYSKESFTVGRRVSPKGPRK